MKNIALCLFLILFCMHCVSCKFPVKHSNVGINDVVKKADELANENKYQQAFEIYKQVYQIDSTNIPALFGIGYCSFKLEKRQEAINYFTKILLIRQDKLSYHYRGVCYSLIGNISAAKNDFDSFLKIDSTSAIASNTYFGRGQLEYKESNYIIAAEYYTRAILIDSAYKESYIERGQCYFNILEEYIRKGRNDGRAEIAQKAMDDFNKALTLDSSYDMAWNDKGMLLIEAKYTTDGIGCVSKAIDINPANGLFYKNRAMGYFYLHKMDSFCMDMTMAAQYKQEGAQEYLEKYCGK